MESSNETASVMSSEPSSKPESENSTKSSKDNTSSKASSRLTSSITLSSQPVTSSKVSSAEIVSTPFGVTLAELEQMLQEYKEIINSLDAKKIDKIEFQYTLPPYDFVAETPSLIERWINLIKKMELSVCLNNDVIMGVAKEMRVCSGKTVQSLGLFGGSMISYRIGDGYKRFKITNYEEIYDEFKALEKAMGYPY